MNLISDRRESGSHEIFSSLAAYKRDNFEQKRFLLYGLSENELFQQIRTYYISTGSQIWP